MTKDMFTMRKSVLFNKTVPNIFQVLVPHSFGVGISRTAGERLVGMGCQKALVLFDKGVEAAGITTGVIDCIKAVGVDVVTCNWVEPDPSDVSIKRIVEFALAEKIDAVVAIGGGATLDSGKVVKLEVNAANGNRNTVLVAIPTTSGTGAELTKSAVVTNSATGTKSVAGGYESMADLALVDPELVVGVPAKVTAACAFDVLAHAIDSTASNFNEPVHQILALEAIRLFKKNCIEVVENGKNIEARAEMHLASTLAGICLNNGNVSICHAFAHAVGAMHHIPHGVCCAIFTPACLEFVADECAGIIRKYADALEVVIAADDDNQTVARKVSEAIFALALRVNVPVITDYFSDFEALCAELIPIVTKDFLVNSCPRGMDEEGARWILSRTFELSAGAKA